MANDFGIPRKRISSQRIRRTKDYQRWRVQRRANMRGAGVVRDQNIGDTNDCDRDSNSRLAGQHDWLIYSALAYLSRDIEFGRRTNQCHVSSRFDKLIGERGVALRWPALGATINRARTKKN